ncbi:MAG: DUF1259 domain-containing protein [Myxococcales bacterium]|nr:DUF1259 domain-containing protein [Myxococcales bacterium]
MIAILLAAALNPTNVEKLTGLKGKLDEKEHVFKVSYPRADIEATAAGVKLTPPLGLTAWAAFTGGGAHTMVMGDMVMTEDQVAPAMDAALDNGLEVTALHNHFAHDSPRVMFMHIGGIGDESKLASAVGKVIAVLKAKPPAPPQADIDPGKSTLDAAKLDAAFGKKGEYKDGVYKVVFGRTTKEHGMTLGNTMGVNTWAALAGSEEKAVIDGDFAMLESELQGVLKALRAAGIDVVAIHSHMSGEQPRILFLHYWGVGAAQDLAKGVRAALAKTKT